MNAFLKETIWKGNKFEELWHTHRAKIVVDSAFQIERGNWLLQSAQLDPLNANGLILNRESTSLRQLSEWGMRMIQSSFPRLKDALPVLDNEDRFLILHLMTHLHNFHAASMDLNQIFNSFMETDNSFYAHEYIDPEFIPQI